VHNRWNVVDRMRKLGVSSSDIKHAVPEPDTPYTRRVLQFIGVDIPVGRMSADDAMLVADFADSFSDGEIRLTVEQGVAN
jgi:dissimilatory sulfite reductase (desulfoviridin) alpha/beta subunit